MKKSLLALAVLGAFAGAASAQSSVTLFGIVDVNVGEIKNETAAGVSTKLKREGTDGINSSRLGFRGVEDLGGGLRAGFWLEAGLSPDTGAAGANVNTSTYKLFNRRATVSLRLGRDYTPSFWNLTVFDPFGTNGVGSFTNLFNVPGGTPLGSGASTLVRADNSIGYFLPAAIGGVYGQAQVAAGEAGTGGTQANNKYAGGRIGYAGGPIDVAIAYGQTTIDANDTKYKLFDVGGAYDFGLAKVMAQYVRGKWDPREQKIWLVGVVVPLGQGEIHAAYSHADYSGGAIGSAFADDADAKQLALGYVYNLSKRTAVYGTVSRVKNDGNQALTVGTPSTGFLSPTGGKSTGAEVGLRHSF
jgi:predicted porin